MISGFQARIFSFMLRKISDRDWPDSVLRPSPMKLSPPRISSTVAPLSIELRLAAMISCCGLSPRSTKNRLLRSSLFSSSQALFFIARWSDETTMTVFLKYGDALIFSINAAICSWLQVTALNDLLFLPSMS